LPQRGNPFRAAIRVLRRRLNKSAPCRRARTGNAYRLRKMSASTESIKDLKADESLAKSRANCGAHRQRKNRDSLGSPRRSRWWIVAPMAVLFSLSAITAVRWYEWELRPLQKYGLAGTRLRPVRHSHKGGNRLRITSGIGRRIGTASGSNWTRKMASSIAMEAPAKNGLIGLAYSIVMRKPTTSP
jgi:hypothetical protein